MECEVTRVERLEGDHMRIYYRSNGFLTTLVLTEKCQLGGSPIECFLQGFVNLTFTLIVGFRC